MCWSLNKSPLNFAKVRGGQRNFINTWISNYFWVGLVGFQLMVWWSPFLDIWFFALLTSLGLYFMRWWIYHMMFFEWRKHLNFVCVSNLIIIILMMDLLGHLNLLFYCISYHCVVWLFWFHGCSTMLAFSYLKLFELIMWFSLVKLN